MKKTHLSSCFRMQPVFAQTPVPVSKAFPFPNVHTWLFVVSWLIALPVLGLAQGTYPAVTVSYAGGNAVVTPATPPVGAESATATTSADFKGLLQVNPLTGAVTITNARPAGNYIVTVRTSVIFGTFSLTVGNTDCSQGQFVETADVPVGSNPYSIAVGDFNGDGIQDLITPNSADNTVSIRFGVGTGGFSGTAGVSVGNLPYSVTIGDFNGDGKQDWATANFGADNISVRMGDGNGNFTGTGTLAAGSNPTFLATGDFNGDGNRDLATTNYNSDNVSICLGDGNGNFNPTTPVPAGSQPLSLAVGDFNDDGKQDLAIVNYNSDNVSICLGDGTGNFSTATYVSVGSLPYSVALGDFNGDGQQDLAVANYNSNDVSIRLGNGTGNFSAAGNVSVGYNPFSVAIGDFNGDGNQDLAVANDGSDNVSIRLGNGTGQFSSNTEVHVGSNPSVVIGDFNGDGKQDLATANYNSNTISVRLGSGREIHLQGNHTDIADGDSTPASADFTDFGAVALGSNLDHPFTVQNTGSIPLTITSITLSDPHASQFSVHNINLPIIIPPADFTSFTLRFAPTSSGIKTATITIINDDCNESDYDFAVQGMANPCPNLVVLSSPADDYSDGMQLKTASAGNGNITAANKITGTAQVTYQANVIELKADFRAESGTVFLAQPGGCN